MSQQFNVAVLGATGAVGEAFLSILQERCFPIANLYPLASERSVGKTVFFNNRALPVIDVATFDFTQVGLALFSAGAAVSAKYAPKAAEAGCIVIDNTSCFRYEADVPLVVPEINPEAIEHYRARCIIANPNCSTIQMVVALKPLHDVACVTRLNVATYQAVSGSGRQGIHELASQTAKVLQGQDAECRVYPKQIAFNVIPQIDVLQPNGYTREEMKMVWETQKILGDDNIRVNATAVRVPSFYGHAEAVHIETLRKLSAEAAYDLLRAAPGVIISDNIEDYPTPVTHVAGQDAVYVGRLREDISHPNGLNLWIVSDNVRKGAALNAVQIAELLIEKYL